MPSNDVVSSAAILLNHLESSDELEIPHLMRRIRDLLSEKLAPVSEDCLKRTATIEPSSDGDTGDDSDGSHVTEPTSRFENDLILLGFRLSVLQLADNHNPIYLDVQFLQTSTKEYVIKEFSAQSAGSPTAWITVKSPADVEPNTYTNDYVTTVLNGLEWSTGVIDIDQLRSTTSVLFKNGRRIYMKGLDKIQVVVRILNIPRQDIVDLFFLPKLEILRSNVTMEEECPFHRRLSKSLSCAKRNTHAMFIYHTDEKINGD